MTYDDNLNMWTDGGKGRNVDFLGKAENRDDWLEMIIDVCNRLGTK